jgi:hypothetical protein
MSKSKQYTDEELDKIYKKLPEYLTRDIVERVKEYNDNWMKFNKNILHDTIYYKEPTVDNTPVVPLEVVSADISEDKDEKQFNSSF